MLNNKNTIIFDFDGTLADTMQIFADVASSLISDNYGMDKAEARKTYLKTSGYPFHQQLEIIFPGNEKNKIIAPIYEEQKIDATADVELEDGALDAIEQLKKFDYRLVISSNNFQYNIDNFISNNNLHDIFDLALGFKEGFAKGKNHFDFAIEELVLEKDEMVFIGDSLNDYRLANGEGIDFIGKIGTFREEDFRALNPDIKIIKTISELAYGK
ncbi:HAD hydrolase-like protein [Candidatus Parcubacteria bacterium]|nr:HAD hydrolase-like protein [Candidatus Parcubacteria bacterium]